MQEIKTGDTVIVTRSRSGLVTTQHKGVIMSGDPDKGFMLYGTDLDTGEHLRSQFAPAHELTVFGITQTVELAP